MNCVIPGPNLKLLGKAVHALAKIGDELHFEADEDHLSLRTVNISTTVFGVIKFFSSFFVHYNLNVLDTQTNTNTTQRKGISCKMPMKAMLAVFRNPIQMEKQIEICKINLDNNPTKITFKFRYKNDVTKTHEVLLLDGDESLEVATLTECLNEMTAPSSMYTQSFANFQARDEDVSIEVTPFKCIFRNYIEGDPLDRHCLRSQLSIGLAEFKHFSIKNDTTICFTLRSFRAAIQFAESFNLNITLNFQQSGKPIKVIITNGTTFEAKFIIATMSTDPNTQTNTTVTTSDCPSKQSFIRRESNVQKSTVENKEQVDYFDSEELDKDINNIPDEVLLIPSSPESPRSKRLKYHFNRCFEPTFCGLPTSNEEIYAENSDPECEALMY